MEKSKWKKLIDLSSFVEKEELANFLVSNILSIFVLYLYNKKL